MKWEVVCIHMFVHICSDNYIMKWGNQGMPKDLDLLNNLRVIFTVGYLVLTFLLCSVSYCYFALGGMQSIVMNVCVCLCLYVSLLAFLKIHTSKTS